MTLDVLTRLSGSTGSSAAGQSIATATAAAPVYSTNWLDLDAGRSVRTYRDLRDIFALAWFTTAPTSATANATLSLQVVMSPKTTPGSPTLAAFNNTTAVAGTVITSTAHGLPNGTRVNLANTSGTMNAGLDVATDYYIVNATTDTFGLAATPGGAAINASDATGTTTVTWFPEEVGAQRFALGRLTASAAQVQLRINPLLLGSRGFPVHRYLFARYVPSNDLTAGVAFCDLQRGAPMSNFPINPNNYIVP